MFLRPPTISTTFQEVGFFSYFGLFLPLGCEGAVWTVCGRFYGC